MKTKKILCLAILMFSTSVIYSQEAFIKEKDPNAYKFIGNWSYEAGNKVFSITFWLENYPLGRKNDGSANRMEVLSGIWSIKDTQGETTHLQKYAVMSNTRQNPNILEGSIYDDRYGKRYDFTLQLIDTNRAVWKITGSKKMSNPENGAILISPPTDVILTKMVPPLPPPLDPDPNWPPDPNDPNPPGHQIY